MVAEPPPKGPRRPGGALARLPPRKAWLLVYLVLVYGVAMIVVSVLWGYAVAPESSSPSSLQRECAPGTLPITAQGPDASLQAREFYPVPLNGSSMLSRFTLWVNTTDELLPGVNVSFAVRSLTAGPGYLGCTLPVPSAEWLPNATSLTLDPLQSYPVLFEGAPSMAYDRTGVFVAETWANETNEAGSLGSTLVFLNVV